MAWPVPAVATNSLNDKRLLKNDNLLRLNREISFGYFAYASLDFMKAEHLLDRENTEFAKVKATPDERKHCMSCVMG